MKNSMASLTKKREANFWLNDKVTVGSELLFTCIYALLFVLFTILVTCFFMMDWSTLNPVKKYGYAFIFLLAGVGHLIFTPVYLQQSPLKKLHPLVFPLLLSALIGLGAFALFTLFSVKPVNWAILSGGSFLLPAVILQGWKYFDALFIDAHTPWLLPDTAPSTKQLSIFLNSVQFKVKIKINYYDISPQVFTITAPGRSLLGKVFHQFIIDQKQIQLYNDRHQPFGWTFSTQKNLGMVLLNPEATIADNKITQHNSIFAERINMDTPKNYQYEPTK